MQVIKMDIGKIKYKSYQVSTTYFPKLYMLLNSWPPLTNQLTCMHKTTLITQWRSFPTHVTYNYQYIKQPSITLNPKPTFQFFSYTVYNSQIRKGLTHNPHTWVGHGSPSIRYEWANTPVYTHSHKIIQNNTKTITYIQLHTKLKL